MFKHHKAFLALSSVTGVTLTAVTVWAALHAPPKGISAPPSSPVVSAAH